MSEKLSSEQRTTVTNMVRINLTISIIILNINGLNALIKRQRSSEWIKKKHYPPTCCLQETDFKYKDTCRLTENK